MEQNSSLKVIIITILIMMFCILSVRSENMTSHIKTSSAIVLKTRNEMVKRSGIYPVELRKKKCRKRPVIFK